MQMIETAQDLVSDLRSDFELASDFELLISDFKGRKLGSSLKFNGI
jgi:hypothetical protein